MSNPIDECLAMRKQAFGGLQGFKNTAMTSMREGAAQAVGQGVVGAGIAGVGMAAMKTYRALRKRSDFKEMMDLNPDLAEHQEQDPTKFNAHYNSMRTLLPHYAEDPVISGALMRQMGEFPNGAGSLLMGAMEGSSKMRGQHPPQFTLSGKISPHDDVRQQESGSSLRF